MTDTKLAKREETLPEQTKPERHVAPFVDIFENNDEILLIADMPGVTKEALQLRIDKDVLSLEGSKSADGDKLLRCEIVPCTYARSFTLPPTVDGEKISASLEHGVLRVHLPKRESVKPRQIQVTAG